MKSKYSKALFWDRLQVGERMNIPHERIPMPNGVLPVLPADNARAANSDRILVLEGNGEGSGDYLVADRTIANLRANRDKPFFYRVRIFEAAQSARGAAAILRSV